MNEDELEEQRRRDEAFERLETMRKKATSEPVNLDDKEALYEALMEKYGPL